MSADDRRRALLMLPNIIERWMAPTARFLCLVIVLAVAALPSTAAGTTAPLNSYLPPVAALAQGAAIADFDGDHKPDFALSVFQRQEGGSNVYSIQVHLSREAQASSFEIKAGHPLHFSPRDVDNDQDVDLVVSTFDGDRVGVWLNDGRGRFCKSDAVMYPESIWYDPPAISRSADDHHEECACPTAGCPDREVRFSARTREERVRRTDGAGAISPLEFLTHRIRPPPSPLFPI